MNTEERESDDRIIIDNLSSTCSNAFVVKASQVAKALQQQSKADFNSLKAIDTEQNKIRTEYLKFLDLEEEKKRKTERLHRTCSLIAELIDDDEDAVDDEFNEYIVPVSQLTLWEAMLSVLEHTGEIQLFELQHTLEQFGKKVTRGAIESAVITHRDKFRAVTRNRDRFVSLKR